MDLKEKYRKQSLVVKRWRGKAPPRLTSLREEVDVDVIRPPDDRAKPGHDLHRAGEVLAQNALSEAPQGELRVGEQHAEEQQHTDEWNQPHGHISLQTHRACSWLYAKSL